jgi:hypothetical protein
LDARALFGMYGLDESRRGSLEWQQKFGRVKREDQLRSIFHFAAMNFENEKIPFTVRLIKKKV